MLTAVVGVTSNRPDAATPVERWLSESRGLSKDEFVRRHPHHFLVLLVVESDAHAFKTELAVSSSESGPAMTVVELKKAPESPYADRVSIGRARNCDAVIRHQSVSKLHAHLRSADDGTPTLTDLGSRVGTFVEGKRLVRDTPVPVRPGAHVRFGNVAGNLFDAAGLWAALGRLGGR
jgi:hypothetical protein